jgi:LysR family glycine cleavage system transcriptional activator
MWLEAAGVDAPLDGPAAERITADNQVLEVAAAVASGAFALASPVMFAADIASGRLAQPFPIVTRHPQHYWLVYPADRRRARKIAAFREWLLAAVAADPAVQAYAKMS